jgi:hypothetical protein
VLNPKLTKQVITDPAKLDNDKEQVITYLDDIIEWTIILLSECNTQTNGKKGGTIENKRMKEKRAFLTNLKKLCKTRVSPSAGIITGNTNILSTLPNNIIVTHIVPKLNSESKAALRETSTNNRKLINSIPTTLTEDTKKRYLKLYLVNLVKYAIAAEAEVLQIQIYTTAEIKDSVYRGVPFKFITIRRTNEISYHIITHISDASEVDSAFLFYGINVKQNEAVVDKIKTEITTYLENNNDHNIYENQITIGNLETKIDNFVNRAYIKTDFDKYMIEHRYHIAIHFYKQPVLNSINNLYRKFLKNIQFDTITNFENDYNRYKNKISQPKKQSLPQQQTTSDSSELVRIMPDNQNINYLMMNDQITSIQAGLTSSQVSKILSFCLNPDNYQYNTTIYLLNEIYELNKIPIKDIIVKINKFELFLNGYAVSSLLHSLKSIILSAIISNSDRNRIITCLLIFLNKYQTTLFKQYANTNPYKEVITNINLIINSFFT